MKEPPVAIIQKTSFRSCGGHVHIGHPALAGDGHEPWLAVYLLDLFVGVPSLWIDHDPTSGPRRSLYGQAGRYRTKDYGIEYRSHGNFWLKSPSLVGWVYDVATFVVQSIESGQADQIWTFDLDTFFESRADAWTCHLYDAQKLRQGVDMGDQSLVLEHYELARNLLPQKLTEELDFLIEDDPDFYDSWELG